MHRVITVASVLGGIGVIETFGLLAIAKSSLGIDEAMLQAIIFLKLAVPEYLTLFVAWEIDTAVKTVIETSYKWVTGILNKKKSILDVLAAGLDEKDGCNPCHSEQRKQHRMLWHGQGGVLQ